MNPIKFALILFLSLIVFVSGCSQPTTNTVPITDSSPTPSTQIPAWMNIELKDVLTQETFKIADFKGKSVLIESFAVWCPTCTAQQRITKEMREEEGNSVVHISLDTDPNEKESTVQNHANSNGFDWFYVVSPSDFTQQLIDEFGLGVVSAPSVPMILICEDQSFRFLGRGLKSSDTLKAEIIAGC